MVKDIERHYKAQTPSALCVLEGNSSKQLDSAIKDLIDCSYEKGCVKKANIFYGLDKIANSSLSIEQSG